jgi:glycosyltransferase involved in cell wall biosynthesis
MRVAIANWTLRRAGGAESYIESVISGLDSAGFETALLTATDSPADRERITIPGGTPVWCISRVNTTLALGELRRWAPDLLYMHSDLDADFEMKLLETAPAVFFAHAYRGTCISGLKSHRFPAAAPCERRFGSKCLMLYYPRRCGGLNPVTMIREYQRQRSQLDRLRSYKMILTASEHMRREYLDHDLPPRMVRRVHLPAMSMSSFAQVNTDFRNGYRRHNALTHARPWRLLFVGRMTAIKGIATLLEALPAVVKRVASPLELTLVGDGPERARLEPQAKQLVAEDHALEIKFAGWAEKDRLEEFYAKTDLLVISSLWPEPFGLVGIEAGLRGVPTAAFAVGGIPEWLSDGINGYLAPANPPTAAGLADAISKCLDARVHPALRQGAREVARQFSIESHIAELSQIFLELAQTGDEIRDTAQL